MKSTARHISVAVACAIVLAGCSNNGQDQGGGAEATPTASSSSTSAPASPGESAEPGGTDTAAPGSGTAAPSEPSTTARSDAPDAVGSSGPVEVLPPSPSDSGLPGLSPAPKPDKALISRPLPAQGTAQGALVRGYPAAVLAPVTDSIIETSSVSPDDRRLQVTLTARTGTGPGAVLLFYRQKLTSLGFTEEKVSTAPGTQAAGFKRGQSSVTVNVIRDGDGSSYTLLSTLYAG